MIYERFNLKSISLTDIRNGYLNSGDKLLDKLVRQAWALGKLRPAVVPVSIAMVVLSIGTLIGTNVTPETITTGAVLGVTGTNNETENEMKHVKTWIDIKEMEISIQIDYRHILHIDLTQKQLCVLDIRNNTIRDIPWKYQSMRIDRIVDLIADAKHEAELTPDGKPKPKTKVTGKMIMDAIAENSGKGNGKSTLDPIDAMGIAIFGDAWLIADGLRMTEEVADSTLQKCLNARRSKIVHAAKRLILWTTKELKVDVWMIKSGNPNGPKSLRRLERNQLVFVKEGIGIRQSCALAEMDYKFVKVIDNGKVKRELSRLNKKRVADAKEAFLEAGEVFDEAMEDQITTDLSEWLSTDGWNGDGHGYSMSDDKHLMKKLAHKLFPQYVSGGYSFIGGNPDSGIMVFVKDPRVAQAKHGQKLAKILLRGGIQLSAHGSMDVLTATIVDFPDNPANSTKEGGYRDGIFMILKRSIFRMLGQENGFNPGSSWQASVYDKETTAMKGMIWSSAKDNKETFRLLAGNDAVVDRKLYNEIYRADTEVDDLVEIPVNTIWIMNIDDVCEPVEMHVSAQMIRRSADPLSNYFHSINMEYLTKMLKAASSSDKRALMEYMPAHGDFRPFKEAGLHPCLKPEWNIDPKTGELDKENPIKGWNIDPFIVAVMVQNVVRANRKGFKIPVPTTKRDRRAYYLRIMHDNSLSVKTDKSNHVGISMPKSSKLKVGDKTIIVTYPALNAGTKMRTVSIFVAVVEKLTRDSYVGIHGVAAKNALRDEDGDMIHIIVPSKSDWKANPEMDKCGMAFVDVTVRDKSAANTKADIFDKKLIHGDVEAISKDCLAVYMKLATNVGIADNRKTSEELYLNGKSVNTPTGESVETYLSRFVQDSIENKKHITLPQYGVEVHDPWSKLTIPEAWEMDLRTGRMKFKNHPELVCQKLRYEDGSMVIGTDGTIEMIKKSIQDFDDSGLSGSKWMDFLRKGVKLNVTEDGFVRPEFYQDIAEDLYNIFGDETTGVVRNDKTREALATVVDIIIDGERAIMQGSESNKRFDEAREFLFKSRLVIRHKFTLAERMFINVVLLSAARPSVWANICDIEFLKLVAHFADHPGDADKLHKMVGLNGRHTITAKKSYKSQQSLVSSGRVSTRLWISKDDGPLPLVSEKMVLEVKNFLTGVEGKDVNLDANVYCQNGFYEVTKTKEYVDKDGNISDTNLYVWLKK
jgi:hypothetical protein|tara:strand:- start:2314 stop:5937 length:3624 start_codon:yes stop_codon:yes gene_type:complete